MKFKTKSGEIINGQIIRNEDDIKNIQRRGYFGKAPLKKGDISVYLGSSDGGFAVYDKDEVERI